MVTDVDCDGDPGVKSFFFVLFFNCFPSPPALPPPPAPPAAAPCWTEMRREMDVEHMLRLGFVGNPQGPRLEEERGAL